MADDLMIEVKGSAQSAESALDRVITKLTSLQETFEKLAPSLTAFTEKMNSIASSSKAITGLKSITDATSKSTLSVKDAESRMAMYQARLDRATVSMNKSAVASAKLAEAQRKLKEATTQDAETNAFLSKYRDKGFTNEPSAVNRFSEPTATDVFTSTPPRGSSAMASDFVDKAAKTASIHFDTSQATSALDKVNAYIDSLTPSISKMSAEAQARFEALSAELTRVGAQLDNQRALYTQLGAATKSVDEGSSKFLSLEKRMLSADGAIDRLVAKSDKLKAQMLGISDSASKASFGFLNFGNRAEKATKKSTSGVQKTLQMMEKMFIRIIAFRIFSMVTQGIVDGLNNIAQASTKANATMSALSTSGLYFKNSVASAFAPLIQAITPAITQFIDTLANLFNMLGMLNARIFGGATSVTVAKKATVDYAASIDKAGQAAKEAQRSILGFDEITALSKPTSSSNNGMPDPTDMFETVKVPDGIISFGDKIKSLFGEWSSYAQPTVEAFNRLTQSLEPLKTFAAQGLTDFYNDFLKPVGIWTLGTGLPRFFDITSALVNKIDWPTLNGAIDTLWKSLVPLTEDVGGGLLWFYENAISPMVEWAANDLIPAALDLVSAALDALHVVIVDLQPLGTWLFDTFLKPLAEWTGGVVVAVINDLTSGLKAFSAWASANQSTVQNMVTLILGFLAGLWVYNTTKALIGFIQTLGTELATLGAKITIAGAAATLANVGFGLLAGAVLLLATNWPKMNGIEKVVGVLGAIAIAAAAAAAAVGALQSAWSLGIAAAAIVAGTAAIAWSIHQANEDAKSNISVPKMASGGLFTSSHIVEVGEGADDEAILPLNSQVFSGIGRGIRENGGIVSGNGIDTERIIDRLDSLEQAISGMKVVLKTNDRTIAESANRGSAGIGRRYSPVKA
ncbi:hypothetical protein ACRQV7_03000 [Caproiciproducens sp. R2]|uniref:hypothetical protein n=1 Tax=Caproiciproducens sp. R2 TaxID=3435187 RepID=UPI004033CC5D